MPKTSQKVFWQNRELMRGRIEDINSENQRSLLNHLENPNSDIQRHFDDKFISTYGRYVTPLVFGEIYKSSVLDKWLKKK